MFDPLPPVAKVIAGRVEAGAFSRLLGKRLHDPDAGEHAGERRHLLAGGIPEPIVPRVDVPPEDPRSQNHQRHGNEREEGQLGIDPDEHRPHAEQLHDLEEKAPRDLVHESMQCLAVVRDAADH